MINPVLKWALQVLQQPKETSVDETGYRALNLVGIDPNQIQQEDFQPLESIFSKIGDHTSSVVKKKIPWQELDAGRIVYPIESVDNVSLNVSEPPGGWNRFYTNENLALALIEKFGTFLSISSQVPHISFYDVVKSAAAIHDCFESGETDKPFLLVSGDFSGIQDAIYTISSSGALKTLRSRSFMLELLTEHIVYELQQTTGSGRYSLIFSGGGGFSLLVPNAADNRKAVNTFINIINEWILEQFGFQLFLAVHCEPVGEADLKGDPFKNVWETMADEMGKQKQRKFWDTPNFKNLFRPEMPKQLANQDACQITHRDDLPDSEMAPEELPGVGRVSKLAYRLWILGDRLTEFDCIVRLPKSSTPTDDFRGGTLLFPTFDSQYAEYKTDQLSQISSKHNAQWVVNNWDLANYKGNKTFPFLFGSYVRSVDELSDEAQEQEREEYLRDHRKPMSRPERVTASFSGLAKAAQGSDLIGCLRMDVDDFGDLFSGKLMSSGIAAISNLSRSMNLFFKGYLNQICSMKLGNLEKKDHPVDIAGKKDSTKTNGRDVSIVYAGGDDLFIFGAWDDIAELAFDINACFREFSGYNPDVHLSGGVTLHKPKFPLYQMARIAKQAEVTAKANEWDIDKTKNSFALFYSEELKTRNILLNKRIEDEYDKHGWQQPNNRIAIASAWSEFGEVIELTKQLQEIYSELPQGFYRRLFETLKIWQEDGKLYMPMLERTLRQLDQIQKDLSKPRHLKMSLFQRIRQLHIPLHWVEYLNRQIGEDN